ncbi:MAG TPA: DEAD/DEAH box helicase [Candidatus Woesebacteria bacterium]|nr:DEAD/DEAH box helicase [Candidatus Woesebacteria bacterium]
MYKNNHFGGHSSSCRQFGNKRNFSRNRFAAKKIDPRLFISPAIETKVEDVVIEHQFSDFPLQQVLLDRLSSLGFTIPTPIQDKTLAKTLSGVDIIGLADTGTGKTLAFALPILNKILNDRNQNALIIAPTRELAVQIRDVFRSLSEGLSIYPCLLIGGSNIQRQIMDLRRRPHIFIGTPGRLLDLYERRVLRLDYTYSVILDEMDRMLDMGFVKDITKILSFLPENHHTMLFSATIDNRVEDIARQFLQNPEKVSVKTGSTSQNIEQNVIKVNGNKKEVLQDLLKNETFAKVLIFGRTKFGVEKLANDLKKVGFQADSIHGDKRQSQREQVLRQFKENQIRILIATDVAARGIDVKDITHVINFDQPATYDDYVHRIGRTGRAGKKGFAITFVD